MIMLIEKKVHFMPPTSATFHPNSFFASAVRAFRTQVGNDCQLCYIQEQFEKPKSLHGLPISWMNYQTNYFA